MPVQFNVLCTTLLKLKFLNCCNNIQRFPINCVVPASHLVSISILPVPNAGALRQRPLSRLERVFRCCSVCETMKDYKEGYLMVWTNYVSLQLYWWAILQGYLWRHISYHDNEQDPQRCPLNFSFCKLSEKVVRWPTIFIYLLESSLK